MGKTSVRKCLSTLPSGRLSKASCVTSPSTPGTVQRVPVREAGSSLEHLSSVRSSSGLNPQLTTGGIPPERSIPREQREIEGRGSDHKYSTRLSVHYTGLAFGSDFNRRLGELDAQELPLMFAAPLAGPPKAN